MGTSSPTAMGSPSDMKLVNGAEVDAFSKLLNGGMGQASGKADAYGSQASGILQKILGNAGNYDNLIKMMTTGENGLSAQLKGIRDSTQSYDPQAGLNAYISRQPELQGLAQQMASGAFGAQNESARGLAQRQSADALSGTASQLAQAGLLGSGAGVSAMTNAALTPTLQMETQLAGQQADLYGNIMGGLSQQALGGLNQGYDAQAGRALQGALGSAQTAQSGFGLLGNTYGAQDQALGQIAQNYGQLAGNAQNLYANLMGQQGQLNQPVYWQPQYEAGKNRGANAMSGMAAGASIGSLFGPGYGTAIGAGLGGLYGLFS